MHDRDGSGAGGGTRSAKSRWFLHRRAAYVEAFDYSGGPDGPDVGRLVCTSRQPGPAPASPIEEFLRIGRGIVLARRTGWRHHLRSGDGQRGRSGRSAAGRCHCARRFSSHRRLPRPGQCHSAEPAGRPREHSGGAQQFDSDRARHAAHAGCRRQRSQRFASLRPSGRRFDDRRHRLPADATALPSVGVPPAGDGTARISTVRIAANPPIRTGISNVCNNAWISWRSASSNPSV